MTRLPSSHSEIPFGSSRGELSGKRQIPEGGGGSGRGADATAKRLVIADGVKYLKEVRETFKDQGGKYEAFVEVLKDFKARRVDLAGVVARVKELLWRHNKLIVGFNVFLPSQYQITLTDEDEN